VKALFDLHQVEQSSGVCLGIAWRQGYNRAGGIKVWRIAEAGFAELVDLSGVLDQLRNSLDYLQEVPVTMDAPQAVIVRRAGLVRGDQLHTSEASRPQISSYDALLQQELLQHIRRHSEECGSNVSIVRDWYGSFCMPGGLGTATDQEIKIQEALKHLRVASHIGLTRYPRRVTFQQWKVTLS
jgi:hypothetical protein